MSTGQTTRKPEPISRHESAPPSRPRRHKGRWIALVLVLLLALDALQPPRRQVMGHAAVGAIAGYQALGRPVVRRFVVCRFEPSCSDYGRQAFAKYGFWPGLVKTTWRIMRCNPWAKPGTVDEP